MAVDCGHGEGPPTSSGIDPRDVVHVTELGVDADHEALGVVDAVEIRWRGITMILAETGDGVLVYGHSIVQSGTDGHRAIGRANAWHRLLTSLRTIRQRRFERHLTSHAKG